MRENTKVIQIGNRVIGGGNPVLIQSMTNTKTEDVRATVEQIQALTAAGCDIIRCAVPTMEAAEALTEIKKEISIPLVADIHFDYRLAIAAIEHGADKIRINPGNIGSRDRVKAVVDAAKERQIPIRVGVNSGSLEKELVEKYHGVTAEGIVESALDKVHIIEDMGYDQLVISIKSSDVMMCARAHELIADKTPYPLHVGITEAGTLFSGNIKSAVGLGIILYQGIGDTIRVSLTGDPLEEIRSAKRILKTLGLRKGGIEVVSCPTCGRTQIDLIGLANQVERMVEDIPLDIRVAVMGCVVNGPGEAKEADIGIAGGVGTGLLIKKGEIVRRLPEDELLGALREGAAALERNKSGVKTGMTKMFAEVFPPLPVEQGLQDLLEQVKVEKVTSNRAKNFIRVYLVSGKLIHKEQLFQLEKILKRQLFGNADIELKILERYELSGQYTPEKLLELYKDSILFRLKHYSILEYNLFKGAKITFPEEGCMKLELRRTTLGEDAADELIRILYKIFTERCGFSLKIRTEFVEKEEKQKRGGRADVEKQAAALIESMLQRAKEEEAAGD